MGVAASSLALLDQQGMLEPYAPLNLDAIMAQYRDKKNPPAWWGMDVWGATVCFNTVEAQKKGIPKPETWKDLTKPVYKGQVVMPNPASSGTGYFDVDRLAARSGATTTARAAAGSTWTRCTRTSRSTRTRAPSPATWRRPASTWSASRSSTAATATRPRARRSTSCSRRKAWAGTSRRSRSTRARRSSRRRRSSPTGRRARTR